jgi:hypothetical protein
MAHEHGDRPRIGLDGLFNIVKEFWADVNHLIPRKALIKSARLKTVSMVWQKC